jgi:hypothetical protein
MSGCGTCRLLDNNDLEGPLPEEIANISTITIVYVENLLVKCVINGKICLIMLKLVLFWVEIGDYFFGLISRQFFCCSLVVETSGSWITIQRLQVWYHNNGFKFHLSLSCKATLFPKTLLFGYLHGNLHSFQLQHLGLHWHWHSMLTLFICC